MNKKNQKDMQVYIPSAEEAAQEQGKATSIDNFLGCCADIHRVTHLPNLYIGDVGQASARTILDVAQVARSHLFQRHVEQDLAYTFIDKSAMQDGFLLIATRQKCQGKMTEYLVKIWSSQITSWNLPTRKC
jgi:hypothetical protein